MGRPHHRPEDIRDPVFFRHPSIWLHSAEAAHGDLGRVTKDDVVIILSHKGD